MIRRLVHYLSIGGLAFLIDAGILWLCIQTLGFNPYLARVISFACALTFTYILNRSLTFADRQHAQNAWLIYAVVSVFTAGVNFGVYSLHLHLFPNHDLAPVLGLAAGTCSAMCVNFALYSVIVFPANRRILGAPPPHAPDRGRL